MTITVGGDDLNLFGIFDKCARQIYPLLRSCKVPKDLAGGPGTGSFATLKTSLQELYEDIIFRAPNAQVYVLGYPNPLPSSIGVNQSCPGLQINGGVQVIESRDINDLYQLVQNLNMTVSSAVTATGLSSVHYVAPNSGFIGNDICSSSPDWITVPQYNANHGNAPLHPNVTGHTLMEASLISAAGAHP